MAFFLSTIMLCAPDEISPGGSPVSPGVAPAAAPAAPSPPAAAAPAAPAAPPRTTADQLPEKALAARLRAHEQKGRQAALAALGIEDVEKFKADLAAREKKLAEYERGAEEQKRASMTELDRLKADLAAKDAVIADLQAQLAKARSEAQSTKADVIIQRTIDEHIDPSMQEYARDALRRHIKALPKEQVRKFGEAEAKAFFDKLAKERPRFAREAPAAPKPPARRPITNGAPPKAAAAPSPAQPPNGKKPASQLTREELRAKWAKFGARMPG